MKQIHDTWGKLVKPEVKSSSCFPNEVRFVVEAEFEKGKAGEMVTWQLPDGKALLQQYFRVFPGPINISPGAANECRSGH